MAEFVETLKAEYAITNIVIIGYDDIVAFLDQYPNVRSSFVQLILTEDILRRFAESFLAERDKEYPKILQRDDSGVVVKKPLPPALQKMVARYKAIPKDSFELIDLNYLELLIYKSVHEDADEDIIEHAFMMLQLPITKLGLNAIEMNAFGSGFRKSMIENLKRVSRFETFSMNCLLAWMFVNAELKKRNLYSPDVCRLYTAVMEAKDIDRTYQEMSLLELLEAVEQVPALKATLQFPDIFSMEEAPGPIGHKLIEQFFSKDYQSAQNQLTKVWQLVDKEYRLLIMGSMVELQDGKKSNADKITTHLTAILTDPDPGVIEATFTSLRVAVNEPVPAAVKQSVLTRGEMELLRQVEQWQYSDLAAVYEYYERVSGVPQKQNSQLVELMGPLSKESLDSMIQHQGKAFAKTFLLEISLNLSISGIYSVLAIESIWRRFDMELFLLDERFPDVLFEEKTCVLFPGSIIGLICDADQAYTINDEEKVNLLLLYHFRHLLLNVNRPDLLLQLKAIVEDCSQESERMQVFLDYLNGDMDDDDFAQWLYN